jgi:putative Mg2+ transporter-C (MgtC) family protein
LIYKQTLPRALARKREGSTTLFETVRKIFAETGITFLHDRNDLWRDLFEWTIGASAAAGLIKPRLETVTQRESEQHSEGCSKQLEGRVEILEEVFGSPYLGAVEMEIRLLLAAFLGALIGLDREVKDKPVGMRPYMVVSIGAAGFGILSMEIWTTLSETGDALDPTRVVQGIIGGLGFLGAGAIIRQGSDHIHGATTGAGIWLAGCIGKSAGFGSYLLAVSLALIALFIFVVVGFFHQRLR